MSITKQLADALSFAQARELRIFDHLFDDPKMVACIAAGIEVSYIFEGREDGLRITATTVNPVAVVTNPDGSVTVYEKASQY